MPKIGDPTRLSKEELLAEWAVREEELRLQFESIKTAQSQSQLLLQRYERIFAYCPVAMLVIDSRARIQEANQAARALLGDALDTHREHLPMLLDDASRLALSQALRGMSNPEAGIAEQMSVELRDRTLNLNTRLVSLDVQSPPNSYALMLWPEQTPDAPAQAGSAAD